MTPIKQELLNTIENAPDEAIVQTLGFLKSLLKEASAPRSDSEPSTLRQVSKWQGDDFEECLQFVYDSRSEAKF
jgi:hypothetical protein